MLDQRGGEAVGGVGCEAIHEGDQATRDDVHYPDGQCGDDSGRRGGRRNGLMVDNVVVRGGLHARRRRLAGRLSLLLLALAYESCFTIAIAGCRG